MLYNRVIRWVLFLFFWLHGVVPHLLSRRVISGGPIQGGLEGYVFGVVIFEEGGWEDFAHDFAVDAVVLEVHAVGHLRYHVCFVVVGGVADGEGLFGVSFVRVGFDHFGESANSIILRLLCNAELAELRDKIGLVLLHIKGGIELGQSLKPDILHKVDFLIQLLKGLNLDSPSLGAVLRAFPAAAATRHTAPAKQEIAIIVLVGDAAPSQLVNDSLLARRTSCLFCVIFFSIRAFNKLGFQLVDAIGSSDNFEKSRDKVSKSSQEASNLAQRLRRVTRYLRTGGYFVLDQTQHICHVILIVVVRHVHHVNFDLGVVDLPFDKRCIICNVLARGATLTDIVVSVGDLDDHCGRLVMIAEREAISIHPFVLADVIVVAECLVQIIRHDEFLADKDGCPSRFPEHLLRIRIG